ncbi:hypothetical protein GCM10020218_093320 [Dactylosporangium vinaceum]
MNLARPEQYFSVLLSQLERAGAPNPARHPRRWSGTKGLVTARTSACRTTCGSSATANQDESTLEFADKTYNRSHVMELPAQRPWLASHGTIPDIERYSAEELRRTFREAKRQHISDVREVRGFLGEVADDLREHGRLVVAPRLQRQLEMFVPVVVAAHTPATRRRAARRRGRPQQDGRSLAADHFLARKVLRSLRGSLRRHPGRPGQIRDTIRTAWELCGLSGVPVRCVALLDDEQPAPEG